MSDLDRGRALLRLGLAEGPDRLVAVRRGDCHADAGAGSIRVPLVVERDRDLHEAVARERPNVLLPKAEHRLERLALLRVELALVAAQPAALHERLLAVGPHLADRD